MGRRSDEERLERYEELIPEYPEGVRASQLARLQGVARSTVQPAADGGREGAAETGPEAGVKRQDYSGRRKKRKEEILKIKKSLELLHLLRNSGNGHGIMVIDAT